MFKKNGFELFKTKSFFLFIINSRNVYLLENKLNKMILNIKILKTKFEFVFL